MGWWPCQDGIYSLSVKILITTLFLPLGLILFSILGLAVFAWRRRYQGGLRGGVGAGLLLGIFICGYLMATPMMGRAIGMLLFEQVKGRELSNPSDVNAIVVLTAGMLNAGPAVGWIPKPESWLRLAVAYDLQRMIDIRLPVIVSGGYTMGVKAPSEARVVADFFARHRTEITPTELEEISTDTYESALQLAPVLVKRETRNVLLVTSDVHMLRALATFRARGIDAIPAPAMTLPQNIGIKAYLPSVYGLGITTDALYEVYALLAYLLSGKINMSDLTYS